MGEKVVYALDDVTIPDMVVFVPEELACELVQLHEAMNSSSTWGDFRQRLSASRRRELDDALAHAEREPPDGDAAFSPDLIPGFGEGDYPEWPVPHQQAWMPREIVDRFGEVERGRDGGYRVFPSGRTDDIVRALEAYGYRCRRDDGLVNRASGITDA